MTNRQKALGCTEYGVAMAKDGEWLADFDSFLAKAATIKKGQYIGFKLFSDLLGFESIVKYEYDVKPFLFGLDAAHNDHFVYTDTNGLDCLTVK